MPWTRKQVRYLESSGSPLTQAQKDKMNAELHANPAMGHMKKGSKAMKKEPTAAYHHTMITHHSDGSHTVEHHPHHKMSGKHGAFMEAGEPKSYSAGAHELLSKLAEHLQLSHNEPDGDEGEGVEA